MTAAAPAQQTRPMGVRRRIRISELALACAFLSMPLTGLPRVTPLGLRVPDVLIGIAMVLVLLEPKKRGCAAFVPSRRAIGVLVGLVLIGCGLAMGEIRRGASFGDLARTLTYPTAAAMVIVVLSAPSLTGRVSRRAAGALVLSASASVLTGLGGARLPTGRIEGLASHQNQLAMSILIALPIAILGWKPARFSGRVLRLAVIALLLYGLNESGSRSGLLGLIAIAGLMAWGRSRNRPTRIVTLLLAALVVVGVLTTVSPDLQPGSSASVARLIGEAEATSSDEERRELISSTVSQISVGTVFLGEASPLERPPHNVFLEILVAGGLTAFVGLALAFFHPVRSAIRPLKQSGDRDRAAMRALALGLVGFVVAVFFNNALWAPFAWGCIALLVREMPTNEAAINPPTSLGGWPRYSNADRWRVRRDP